MSKLPHDVDGAHVHVPGRARAVVRAERPRAVPRMGHRLKTQVGCNIGAHAPISIRYAWASPPIPGFFPAGGGWSWKRSPKNHGDGTVAAKSPAGAPAVCGRYGPALMIAGPASEGSHPALETDQEPPKEEKKEESKTAQGRTGVVGYRRRERVMTANVAVHAYAKGTWANWRRPVHTDSRARVHGEPVAQPTEEFGPSRRHGRLLLMSMRPGGGGRGRGGVALRRQRHA